MLQDAFRTALIAAILAVASTLAIEKLGPRLGSVLATAPGTIIPFVVYLAASSPPSSSSSSSSSSESQDNFSQFRQGTSTTATGMIVTCLYLLHWKICLAHDRQQAAAAAAAAGNKCFRLFKILSQTLFVWFLLSLTSIWCLKKLCEEEIPKETCTRRIELVGYFALFLLIAMGVLSSWNNNHDGGKKDQVEDKLQEKEEEEEKEEEKSSSSSSSSSSTTTTTHFSRFASCFIAMFLTVVLSKKFGGVVGGCLSTFPAIYSTIMSSLFLAQPDDEDEDQEREVVVKKKTNKKKSSIGSSSIGPMILGSSSVPLYALVFRGSFFMIFASNNTSSNLFFCALFAYVVVVVFWCFGFVHKFLVWRS